MFLVAVDFNGVNFSYGNAVNAARDVSFQIKEGEIFGLLGPNGAGKTTLVKLLLGFVRPSSGSIWVNGVDVVRNSEGAKGSLGYLPQSGLSMRSVEVGQALRWTGELRGLSTAAARAQSEALIDELELGSYRRKFVNRLSGGMLRLVNFGMALMGDSKILILDEPTNDLDPEARKKVWQVLHRLNVERGVSCLLVTHNVLEAEQVIQTVGIMRAGRLVGVGTPSALKARIGGKVLIEFRFNDGDGCSEQELRGLEGLEATSGGLYMISVAPEGVSRVVDEFVKRIGFDRVQDFKVVSASLEDLYLRMVTDGAG